MRLYIKNRDNNEISVLIEGPQILSKLAFVAHGLGGNKEQPHIRAMVEAFLENDYTVVTWDAIHTFGESKGGDYADATVTNYYADLEDVIAWASKQSWYTEPFVVCGHSLGGMAVTLFAEKFPEKIRALVPISTVISGRLSMQTENDLESWRRDGIKITMSYDGKREKRLKWSSMEDRMNYDLLKGASKLTMPVLMAVGANDRPAPPQHQQILYEKLPGAKELHIIQGALHSFYEPHEQAELKKLMKAWIAKLATTYRL